MKLRLIASLAIVAGCVPIASALARPRGHHHARAHASAQTTACRLGNGSGRIKHVIYLQFDNTHYTRDRSNVASDLEQMPHLLAFMRQQGTLFTNDHTILISHTAGGIVSSLTGLYPDRNGQTVSNSYDWYRADGSPAFTSSFKYWTDVVARDSKTSAPIEPMPNMVTDGGKTTPAPWVPYTRAGCDFGGVGTANIELENTTSDIATVFGPNSAEAAAAKADQAKAQADYVGIAIHCAVGGGACAGSQAAHDDPLPDEPGGYNGFKALYGAASVDPAITDGHACVNDTDGNPIKDPKGNCGFPGFDAMLAKNTLGYVAQMQEAGVPVTYAYISDAHDNHDLGRASGPGEADYRAQLKAYDDAFAAFFERLARDGINKSNTLFVVTADEGDHFAGGTGTPQADGSLAYSHTGCVDLHNCPPNQLGEVTANLKGVTGTGSAPWPKYDLHFDDAPTIYVNGQPARGDTSVRALERHFGATTTHDPYAGKDVPIADRMVDTVGEKALHMINADPKRTPTFTMFGNPDFYFQASDPKCGDTAAHTTCVDPKFAYNHGDYHDDIATTWLGVVGPGVQRGNVDSDTWTDHTNVRPTMLSLLGLHDDYVQDGRVLIEGLETKATPQSLIAHR
ncbi:MAG TPA: hypothetical protein VE570_02140, partial [Thermoleophilaceae bacterium]|nr:hypothetical protein [Thermoleophilaceae bacterium]